jgi:hypothetical protein
MQLKNTFALTPAFVGLRRGKPALSRTRTIQLTGKFPLTPALSLRERENRWQAWNMFTVW